MLPPSPQRHVVAANANEPSMVDDGVHTSLQLSLRAKNAMVCVHNDSDAQPRHALVMLALQDLCARVDIAVDGVIRTKGRLRSLMMHDLAHAPTPASILTVDGEDSPIPIALRPISLTNALQTKQWCIFNTC